MTDDRTGTKMLNLIADEIANTLKIYTRYIAIVAIHLHGGDRVAAKAWALKWIKEYFETNDEAIQGYVDESFNGKGN